jgi:stalled ribosome rescue protein Dom34
MKKVGVWLDKRVAYVFLKNDSGTEEMRTVFSKTEEREEISKAYRDRVKQGATEKLSDKKLLEHEKNELNLYFTDIVNHFQDADEIVLFGPSLTAERLYKRLEVQNPLLKAKIKDVIKVDSMTKNQIRALIKNYYSN